MILAYAVCTVSVAPLKAEPSHRSEQTSQILFGERVQIVEQTESGWAKVICEWDNYIGWVLLSQLQSLPYKEYKKQLLHINYSTYDCIHTNAGSFLLSPGSSLFQLRKKSFLWQPHFAFKGSKMKLISLPKDATALTQLAHYFIGTPYQWGGRSTMGIDCSGLSQMVYKMMNIRLERDASQQAEQGAPVHFLDSATCGDLAFFDNEQGRINHVGILLSNNTIIHASESAGCVAIDTIDNGGIISKKLKKRTHQLRIIKRIL